MLATDALSKWVLLHKTEKPWETLAAHGEDFDAFVGELISSGEVKNDDVTLIVITIT